MGTWIRYWDRGLCTEVLTYVLFLRENGVTLKFTSCSFVECSGNQLSPATIKGAI